LEIKIRIPDSPRIILAFSYLMLLAICVFGFIGCLFGFVGMVIILSFIAISCGFAWSVCIITDYILNGQ
jgi:hypothetical protein